MGIWSWAKRFIGALVVATAILFGIHALKGYPMTDSAAFGALWGAIAAAIFTLVGYLKYRRSPACMLPRRDPR